jgi:hypothetical protein
MMPADLCHRKGCQHPRSKHFEMPQHGEWWECLDPECPCAFFLEPEAVPHVQAPWVGGAKR